MHTLVIGAGVVGLSCGYELSGLGHSVTVVDSGPIGAGASAGNAGWITPVLATPRAAPGVVGDALRTLTVRDGPARIRPRLEPGFAGWAVNFLRASTSARNAAGTAALQQLARRAIGAFDHLQERGVEFELHDAGLIVAFKTARNLENYRAVVARMRALGYQGGAQFYRGGELREFDPALSSDLAGAVHFAAERHVRPETLTQGLAEALRHNGCELIEHDAVAALGSRSGGRWTLTTGSGRTLDADSVVVAAGYGTRKLLQPLGIDIPIEVAKGTSLTALGRGTVPQRPLKLYENMVACSPFAGAVVRLSGTYDIGARNLRLDQARLDTVVRQGRTYLHDWEPVQTLRRWVGHRPTTVDDLPVIGPAPGNPGLYVATGHGTLGVTLGPITAALAAAEIHSGTESPELRPFRLSRFR